MCMPAASVCVCVSIYTGRCWCERDGVCGHSGAKGFLSQDGHNGWRDGASRWCAEEGVTYTWNRHNCSKTKYWQETYKETACVCLCVCVTHANWRNWFVPYLRRNICSQWNSRLEGILYGCLQELNGSSSMMSSFFLAPEAVDLSPDTCSSTHNHKELDKFETFFISWAYELQPPNCHLEKLLLIWPREMLRLPTHFHTNCYVGTCTLPK